MNIVETIKVQVSGPVLGHLSSLTGMSEETTRSSVGVAIPALLASLSGLASSRGGAERLVGALKRFDPRAPGSLAGLLDERPDQVAEKGAGLADWLLGSSGVSTIVHSLSRSFGIGSAVADRLLGFLTPTVLSGIARQFPGRSINAKSLASFFSDQRRNITQALPGEMAGAKAVVKEAAATPAESARATDPYAAPGMRLLLPIVLGLAAIAVAVLLMRPRSNPAPRSETFDAATQLGSDLHTTVGSITGTLGGITDVASAEAAVPRLEEAKQALDEIRSRAAQLPEPQRAAFDQVVQQHLGALQEQTRRLESMPGAGEKIRPVLDDVMSLLSTPVATPPPERTQEVR